MSATTVFCHILDGNVTVITDLNGTVTNVVCPEFSRLTHRCRLKNSESGFLGSILRGLADRGLDTRAVYCEFGDPNHFLGNR